MTEQRNSNVFWGPLSAVARGRFSRGGFGIWLKIGRPRGASKPSKDVGGEAPHLFRWFKSRPGLPRPRKRPIFNQIQNPPLLNPPLATAERKKQRIIQTWGEIEKDSSAVARGRFSRGGFWIWLKIGRFRGLGGPGGLQNLPKEVGGFAPHLFGWF